EWHSSERIIVRLLLRIRCTAAIGFVLRFGHFADCGRGIAFLAAIMVGWHGAVPKGRTAQRKWLALPRQYTPPGPAFGCLDRSKTLFDKRMMPLCVVHCHRQGRW